MRSRLGIVLCILIGSFCVHCAQSMMTSLSHDGGAAVGDALGDACCTPPGREAPTVLFDGLVSPTPVAGSAGDCFQASPVFDTSGYRTIVIHTPQCAFVAQFRNGKAGFVVGQENVCLPNSPLGHVMTVDALLGHDLRVNLGYSITASQPDGSSSCEDPPVPLTVVGYKNP